jgi:hypothetical protein
MIKSLKRMRTLALSSVLALHAAYGLRSVARADAGGDWNATAASVFPGGAAVGPTTPQVRQPESACRRLSSTAFHCGRGLGGRTDSAAGRDAGRSRRGTEGHDGIDHPHLATLAWRALARLKDARRGVVMSALDDVLLMIASAPDGYARHHSPRAHLVC